MKIHGQGTLYAFMKAHTDVRKPLLAWFHETKKAEWHTPQDIYERYPYASFIHDNRVVFNIKGNRYRLDAKIDYKRGLVRVVRIGTHADYDKWEF